MTARDVIRSAMDKRRAAAVGGCFVSGQNTPDDCADGTCACARTLDRDASAILAALRAAGFAVVPMQPTEAMKSALNGWAVCAGNIDEGWRAACDAPPETHHG